jgi:hypothetical protein
MVATDSRTLIVIPLEDVCGQESFIVDAKVLDQFADFRSRLPRSGPIEASLIGDRVELKFRREGDVFRVEHQRVEGRFPDCDAVIPKDGDGIVLDILVDAKLLRKIADHAVANGTDVGLRIQARGPNQIICLTSYHEGHSSNVRDSYYLMPVSD